MNIQEFKEALVITNMTYPSDPIQEFKWVTMNIHNVSSWLLEASVLETNSKEYIPKAKDKLFFYPGCNVPRYKVREWGKKNKITITVKEDKADVKFGCNSSIMKCLSQEIFMKIPKNDFAIWLNKNYVSVDATENLLDSIEKSEDDFVYLKKYGATYNTYELSHITDYRGNKTSSAIAKGLVEGLDTTSPDFDSYYRANYVTDSNKTVLESLLLDTNVYDQEAIIGLINEDLMIINTEMYENLRTMFKSANSADKVMAIEVMANCNILPSLHYVMLLIREFNQVLYSTKESKHVNFKSLLEYIGIDRNGMGRITDDKMVAVLMEKDVLTMEIVTELAAGVKTLWKDQFDSKHFKIKTITLSDEVQNYFKLKNKLTGNPAI